MSGFELIAAVAAMALGAALQGSIGFGQNLVAAPMVALIEPEVIPGGLLTASLFMNSLILLRERNDFDLGEVSWALVGRVPGVVIGAFAVTMLSRDGLGLALGIVVLFAALANVAGFQIARTPRNKFAAGLLSGIGATAVGIGGPPVAMLYANVEGKQLRATMSVFMMVGTVISVMALAAFGEYGATEFKLGLQLVPGVLIGFAASSKLGPFLDRGYIRPLVIGVSIVSALSVLAKSLA